MSEAKHTATPWDFTIFSKPDGSETKTAQDVAETVAHSALQCEGTELWGVSDNRLSDDGAVLVICYTGNGPTSAENASFIARACNAHGDMLATLNEMCRIIAFASPETLVAAIKRCYDDARSAIAKAEGRGMTSESALLRALTVESHLILDGEPSRQWSPLALRLIFAAGVLAVGSLIAVVAVYGPGAPK